MMHAGEVARSELAHMQQAARPPRKQPQGEFALANSAVERPNHSPPQDPRPDPQSSSVEPSRAVGWENGREPGRPPCWSHINQPRPSDIISATTALTRHLVGLISGVPRVGSFSFLSCRVRCGTWLASVLRAALRGDPSGSFGGVPHPCF